MAHNQVIKLVGPQPASGYSRVEGFFTFEDLDRMTVKLEVTKLGATAADGSRIPPTKIRRFFNFDGDPLTLGASALLALTNRKVDVPFYQGGVELFLRKKDSEPENTRKKKNKQDPNDQQINTRRYTEQAWVPDPSHLAEIQTFQTQRTKKMMERFLRGMKRICGELRDEIRKSEGQPIQGAYADKLHGLLMELESIQSHRESALFEIVILVNGPGDNEKNNDKIAFKLDEVEVASFIFSCQQIAMDMYSGGKDIYIKGVKINRDKGRYTIGTGTASRLLSPEQQSGLKAAFNEFLQDGIFRRHLISDGISVFTIPTVTQSGDYVPSGALNLDLGGRITSLNYSDVAKLSIFIQ